MAARKTTQRRGGNRKNAGQFSSSPMSWGAACLSVFALAAGSAVASGAGDVNASGPSRASSVAHRWKGPQFPCGAGNDCAIPHGSDPLSVTVNGKNVKVKCAKGLHAWDFGTRNGGYTCELPTYDKTLKGNGFRFLRGGKGRVS